MPTLRERWYAEVIRTRLVNGACRELLSLLAVRHMTDTGHVSVPRATLAAELGVTPQRITDRYVEAAAAGLLARNGGGHNGAHTRYRAVLPAVKVPAEAVPTRRLKVPAEAVPTGRVGNGSAVTFSSAVGTGSAGSIRARAPSEHDATTTTSTGDGSPPADGDRGTRPPPAAAATTTTEGNGHNGLGDYLAGRTRLATQVGQGNHSPRARNRSGSSNR